mmetsp:Transcript_580/g.1356  ORF Transcript_580/g.1356 Transcript_580/m.1356 type:complete len:225 (+) Transcript_580:1125-1799(+)
MGTCESAILLVSWLCHGSSSILSADYDCISTLFNVFYISLGTCFSHENMIPAKGINVIVLHKNGIWVNGPIVSFDCLVPPRFRYATPIISIITFGLRHVFDNNGMTRFGNTDHFSRPRGVKVFLFALGQLSECHVSPFRPVTQFVVSTVIDTKRILVGLVKLEGISNRKNITRIHQIKRVGRYVTNVGGISHANIAFLYIHGGQQAIKKFIGPYGAGEQIFIAV